MQKNCRVYINNNVFTKAGILNLAIGTFRAIIYEKNKYLSLLPISVIVELDNSLIYMKYCFNK